MGADELARTFLFSALDRAQLAELGEAGEVVTLDPGEPAFEEGTPADHLWVLLEGSVTLSRRLHQEEVVVATMDRPGAWAGGLRAYGPGADQATYMATGRAGARSQLFKLSSDDLSGFLTSWFPLGKHLLDGMFQTVRGIDALVRQRSALLALGTLAAGLAHELNNPVGAAAQAARELRGRVEAVASEVANLEVPAMGAGGLRELLHSPGTGTDGRDEDPLAAADREEALATRLEGLGVPEPWSLVWTLVSAGLDEDTVERVAAAVPADGRANLLSLVGNLTLARRLVDDIEGATRRIADLVGAVRDYSQLDRAPIQEVDLRDGLQSTLRMLSHRLGEGVAVKRDYAEDLPLVEGHPGELNQVWTNLLDNAIDAVDERGVIDVRVAHDGDGVVVEIADDGPGLPDDVRDRVFEPFFTTKEVGRGTGLGLDIARRIVVDRHHGTIDLESSSTGALARVRLPRRQP